MIRIDGIEQHLDAQQTIFFARELEQIESKLYEYKYPELKYRTYLPVTNATNEGAETVTYRMYDKVGMAKIIANYADDLPRADVFGTEHTQKVKTIGVSFGYNTQEIRAASFANKPLDSMKAAAARRAVREKESSVAWNGDVAHGIVGFLANTNIPTLAALNGAAGSPTWALKTADEIIKDVRIMTSKVRTQSKGVHNANTILLPIDQYDIAANTPRSTNSDMTIMEFITKPGNSFGISKIDWLATELDSAFTSGTEDGAVCYERDSEVLELDIPMEMLTHPVQAKNLEFNIPVESRIAGVKVRYPLGILFFTGI